MPAPSESLRAAALSFASYVCVLRSQQYEAEPYDDDEPDPVEQFTMDYRHRSELHRLAVALATELQSSPWSELAPRFVAMAMRADPEGHSRFDFDHELSEVVALLAPVLGRRIVSFRDLAEVAAGGGTEPSEQESVGEWSEAVTEIIPLADMKPTRDTEEQVKEDRPSDDRQSDIIAAIVAAGTPLQRTEILTALNHKVPGRFKADLSWMVKHGVLETVRGLGYWPCGRELPK